jgi:hypothetical protein
MFPRVRAIVFFVNAYSISSLDTFAMEEQDEDNLAIKKACLYQGSERFSKTTTVSVSRIGPFFPG